MSRKKLNRFEDNKNFPNIIQEGKEILSIVKGRWNELFFKNNNPIVIELGCGRGEYSIALAQQNKNKNYIGIDVKGARIWNGSKYAIENNIPNVAFLRVPIWNIEDFFSEGEISEYWMPFPDPYPKSEKRRLMHPLFLEKYKRISKPDTWVHIKTDNDELFEFAVNTISTLSYKDIFITYDLNQSDVKEENSMIQSNYEKIFRAKGKKIKYIRFKIK